MVLVVENRRKQLLRPDHPVLVEQGQLALRLQHPLDHEHHVRAAGVVLVEHQRHRPLDAPGQHALAELGHLLAVAQHDGVLADQVDPRDVAVEVDPDHRPVQPRGDLLDVGRLAGAVIALDHHPAVVGEAGADRQRGLRVELVGVVEVRHVAVAMREGRHLHVGIDPEGLAHADHLVGRHVEQGVVVGGVVEDRHNAGSLAGNDGKANGCFNAGRRRLGAATTAAIRPVWLSARCGRP